MNACHAEPAARPETWLPLPGEALRGPVTLPYAARDRERNNAVALSRLLTGMKVGTP